MTLRNRLEVQPGVGVTEACGSTQPNGPTSNAAEGERTQTQTAGRVSPERQETTKAGKPRQRMKWTEDMNNHIMRCYYQITHLETNLIYRQELHTAFIERFPHIQVTEQRIADQRRTIITNNLIPEFRLTEIRAEVARELNEQEAEEHRGELGRQDPGPDIDFELDPHQPTARANERELDEDTERLRGEFQRALIEFDGTDPLKRPTIPRQNSSKKLATTAAKINSIIAIHLTEDEVEFEELHSVIYAAAVSVVRFLGGEVYRPKRYQKAKKAPAWEHRLSRGIEDLRRKIGQLTQYTAGNRSNKVLRSFEKLQVEAANHSKYNPINQSPEQMLDTLRQKLAAKSKRLRRYRESRERKEKNSLFQRSEKLFYRSLREATLENRGHPPPVEEVETFWRGIWSERVNHDEDVPWIATETERLANIPTMEEVSISSGDVTIAVNKTQNWKAPGPDGIHNFWIKRFTAIHPFLAKCYTSFLQHPEFVPPYLSRGVTYLLPKDQNTRDPSKYRPITCLCTLYKILTSCLADKIYLHLSEKDLLSIEQKGCAKRSQGCKELLIIDTVAMEQAVHKSRNIYMAFIDYRKAFDSVPHSWLIRVLHMHKIDPSIIALLEHLMSSWATVLSLNLDGKRFTSDHVPIRRGIFQGDSLSPLWFCLSLNPLSSLLNGTGYGYKLRGEGRAYYRLSHLMYMDDIKLYASTDRQLHHLIKLTEKFSNSIRMSFGLDKCKTLSIEKGKIVAQTFNLELNEPFDAMDQGDYYKYLGLLQSRRIDHKDVRKRVTDIYLQRVTAILRSYLNGKNTFKAINTYAIPVLTYTFGIIKWPETELENLLRSTRVLLTKHRAHHPKSAVERLILPRSKGGRGLTDIKYLYRRQVNNLRQYFLSQNSQLHQAIVEADTHYTPLDLHNAIFVDIEPVRTRITNILQQWAEKHIHGRHAYDLTRAYIDEEASNAWLHHGDIFVETEGFILAIQDQVIPTKNYLKYIIRADVADDTCRRCHQASETIQHITGACQTLAATDYLTRHNQVAKIIHQSIARKYNLILETVPYYKYTPEAVMENHSHKLYWDRSVITDRPIISNRPDLILIDKLNKLTLLMDIGIPNTHNIEQYFNEKINKYLPLAAEIKDLWRQEKVLILPLIISTTGVVPKTLTKNLQLIGLHPNLRNPIQKAVILGTTSTVRAFLNIPV